MFESRLKEIAGIAIVVACMFGIFLLPPPYEKILFFFVGVAIVFILAQWFLRRYR